MTISLMFCYIAQIHTPSTFLCAPFSGGNFSIQVSFYLPHIVHDHTLSISYIHLSWIRVLFCLFHPYHMTYHHYRASFRFYFYFCPSHKLPLSLFLALSPSHSLHLVQQSRRLCRRIEFNVCDIVFVFVFLIECLFVWSVSLSNRRSIEKKVLSIVMLGEKPIATK